MMKNKYIFLFLSACLTLGSCVEDNSTIDYKTLNQIEIADLAYKYTVYMQHNLVIRPDVTLTDNDVSYVWYAYSTESGARRDTLATTKDLDVQINGQHAVPGKVYTLVFRVTDNKTGVYTSTTTTFEALGLYTKGLLMLVEYSGQLRLDMLLNDGTILANIYEDNNGGKLSNAYKEVYFSNPNDIRQDLKQVFLLKEGGEGGVALDPVSMVTQRSMAQMLNPIPSDPQLNIGNYTGKMGNIEYLLINKKINKRLTNMNQLEFQSASLTVYGKPSDYTVGGIIHKENQPILYDDLNGRLITHHPWNMGSLLLANPATAINTFFDSRDIGDFDYKCSGLFSGTNYWMILQERTTKEFYLFKFSLVKGSNPDRTYVITFTSTAKILLTSEHAANLTTNAVFIPNTNIAGMAFYILNGKIYALNVANVTSGSNANAEAMLVDLGANITVNKMEFTVATVPAPTESNPNATRSANQIRVLLQDNSLSSLKGGLVYYEITTIGGIKATEVFRKIGGFCDKVIDIDEKLN